MEGNRSCQNYRVWEIKEIEHSHNYKFKIRMRVAYERCVLGRCIILESFLKSPMILPHCL